MRTLLKINKWGVRGDRCGDYGCVSIGLTMFAFLINSKAYHYELRCGKPLLLEPLANPRLNSVLTELLHNHCVLSIGQAHCVLPTVVRRRVPHPILTAEVARLEQGSNG